MKTWILAETLLKPSEETLFLQELAFSKSNYPLLRAIESHTKHRALNYVDQRVYNFMMHNKRIINRFTAARNMRLLRDYRNSKITNGFPIYATSKLPFGKENIHFLHGVNVFSKGTYRVYKNKIYKLMERL